ncbi:hypothetical protein V6Z11_A11G151700 [Gossypium hirsutum]|uniref:Secreted protein n=1 Tax=Gossypium hirsutum TaxID=3635 RepID=A0ABM2Z359_GOSHI|nr:uncharacterized protein LOC121209777 [Gossypium hirsutum]
MFFISLFLFFAKGFQCSFLVFNAILCSQETATVAMNLRGGDVAGNSRNEPMEGSTWPTATQNPSVVPSRFPLHIGIPPLPYPDKPRLLPTPGFSIAMLSTTAPTTRRLSSPPRGTPWLTTCWVFEQFIRRKYEALSRT